MSIASIIKRIFIFPLLLIFFPALCIFVGANNQSFIAVWTFCLPFFFILLIILPNKYFIKTSIKAYKYTPLKNFCYLYLWIIISGIIAVCCGYYSFGRFLYIVIFSLIFRCFLLYIYPVFIIPKFISMKKIINIFVIIYFCITIWGIIEFIGAIYNIQFLNNLVNLFSNLQDRIIMEAHSNLPRIRSFFAEPSHLAKFLVINLPLMYELTTTKFCIRRNIFHNRILSISLILLFWVNLILTQSPIWVVFGIFVTIIYFYKKILNFIIKNITLLFSIFLFLILFSLIFYSNSIDITKTFFVRIKNTIEILSQFSLSTLIMVESSLATRIICFAHQILLFLKYPFTGIGFGNTGPMVIEFFKQSPIPLNYEMIQIVYSGADRMTFSTNAMYLLLCQTGIIGFILYLLFMIKTIRNLNIVKKLYSKREYYFINGLSKTIIAILIFSILYTQTFLDEYLLFYTGLSCSIILEYRRLLHKGSQDD